MGKRTNGLGFSLFMLNFGWLLASGLYVCQRQEEAVYMQN
jgi:hypothetical protein